MCDHASKVSCDLFSGSHEGYVQDVSEIMPSLPCQHPAYPATGVAERVCDAVGPHGVEYHHPCREYSSYSSLEPTAEREIINQFEIKKTAKANFDLKIRLKNP